MLYTTHRRKTRESKFVASLSQGMTDGLLMVLPMDPGAHIDSIRRRDFPYVLIDHAGQDEQGPSVGATNLRGAIDATQLPDRARAPTHRVHHRQQEMGCAQERLRGYREAHQAAVGFPSTNL